MLPCVSVMRQRSLRQTGLAMFLGLAVLATTSASGFCRGGTGQGDCCRRNHEDKNSVSPSLEGSHRCCKELDSEPTRRALALGSTPARVDLDKRTSLTENPVLASYHTLSEQHLLPAGRLLDHQSTGIRSRPVFTCALLI